MISESWGADDDLGFRTQIIEPSVMNFDFYKFLISTALKIYLKKKFIIFKWEFAWFKEKLFYMFSV